MGRDLLFLSSFFVIPYGLLTALGWVGGPRVEPAARMRVSLSVFFIVTSIAHFALGQKMARMLPSELPYRLEIIYVTGVFEFLGAVGVWLPKLRRLAGACLMLMMLAVLPANIYSAIHRVDFGGHVNGPAYLWFRVPFQFFIIAWIYLATQRRISNSVPGGAGWLK